MLRIVAIGGGTGLPVLLRGLAGQADVSLSAIVTVADNGGSSGRLRNEFGMPAVGDLRNCLVALTEEGSPLAALFQHRFTAGGSLAGHALGNLIVAALYQKTGSLVRAVQIAEQIMPVRGRAMAATEVETTLCAALCDGTVVRGEAQIAEARGEIERVWLEPDSPPAALGVLDAIRTADAIVLAPGSLYSSLVPNLLVDGVAETIRKSAAVKIYVCNLVTQPGETDGFSASDHLRVVESYLGTGVIQYCLVNLAPGRRFSRRDQATGAEFVLCDIDRIRALGAIPVSAHLLAEGGDRTRHDSIKLGRAVAKLALQRIKQPSVDKERRGIKSETQICHAYL
jgi:uncharacterized cofD-like protein